MSLKLRRVRQCVAVCCVLIGVSASHAAPNLDGLAGGWSGFGSMRPKDGAWEKVRCKVAYGVTKPGRAFTLDLKCASDAYKMALSANIVQDGAQLSGNWFESEYRQGGKISGTASDEGLIEARIEGETVAALVTIKTKGSHQSFVMDAPGSWLSQVAIELNKDAN